MSRRRFIADEIHGNTAALVGEHAAHLARVLRAQVGQEFDISAAGVVRRGTITAISAERAEFALGEEYVIRPVPRLEVALAIFKFDRMEWAIEKCTELGVARIVPVIARRTDSHLAAVAVKRTERWRKIARQASEQSRRVQVPEVELPLRLKEFGASTSVSSARIVLAENEQDTTLRHALGAGTGTVTLAIGPEGGWTDEELQGFREGGWVTATLGTTILRAETAAIVATALALDAMR